MPDRSIYTKISLVGGDGLITSFQLQEVVLVQDNMNEPSEPGKDRVTRRILHVFPLTSLILIRLLCASYRRNIRRVYACFFFFASMLYRVHPTLHFYRTPPEDCGLARCTAAITEAESLSLISSVLRYSESAF